MGSLNEASKDVLSVANHPPIRIPGPNLLHLLVERSSQDGNPAIDFLTQDGDRISLLYPKFQHAADTLAARISALAGATADEARPFVVPVLLPQSPELYIALLAILKAGGAFCPMNLDVPLERAKFISEDVSATVAITTSSLASRLPRDGLSLLIVDEEPSINNSPVHARHRQARPQDLAYVMYTSGSTGTPKGVGVSHDAATQSLLAHDRHIPQFSRFLQFAAPTFDVSVFEIFFPLFRGKTVVSCHRPRMLNDLPAVINDMEVDACELTPTVAGSLLRRRENVPGLRLLLTIGEMLTTPVVDKFGGNSERPSMLWGMYGPTEAAIHCTLQPSFSCDSAVHTIGSPLDTVSAFILSVPDDGDAGQTFTILPRGQIGELAVGGHQLAEGYLNRPEQTAAAFIDTAYGRLYRTGDKAVMRPDGTLECLGRIADGQVKLRGQRIELGEVEQAALRTSGCHGAVAAVTDATLVLFCAVDALGDPTSKIRVSCKKWLPGFMLPGDIVVVESFPRLASGKIDRKRLVADYKESRNTEMSRDVHQGDAVEKQLCDLVGEVLGSQIQPDQDLSRAGLDSLSAIRVASTLRQASFDIGAIEVLKARTITALRARLSQATGLSPRDSWIDADSRDLDLATIAKSNPALSSRMALIEAIIPCTALQTSMLAETVADARAYCNWVELRFSPTVLVSSIRSWFLQLAQMNEILRTGFVHRNGRFLQVIFRDADELTILISECPDKDFQITTEDEFLSPCRVTISPGAEQDETTVILYLHHAIYDGWSLDLLLSDLALLTQRSELHLRPQFREVSAYYESKAFRDSCDAAREFWTEKLLGFQPAPFPTLHQKTPSTSEVLSSSISLNISPRDVKSAMQRISCSPQALFQAVVVWLWSAIVGNPDVVVGSVTSGRTIPVSRVEEILGPCIASLPIRTSFTHVRTIKDLLVSIHAGNREALLHGTLPLWEIKRAAGISSGQTLYDVLFIYQEALQNGQATDVFREVAHQDYLETRLLVEVEPRESDFNCRFTYHSNSIPSPQIDVLKETVRALLFHILDNLDSDMASMLSPLPSHLLSIANPNPTSFSGMPDLAHAVERIAAKYPEKDALCFADCISEGMIKTTTISFAELSSAANRIAWHLRDQGLDGGRVVAIIMEKSIDLYAGILAIQKAGCAYLPLLPSTPFARIEAILQQAKVEFCLTDTDTHELLEWLQCKLVDVQKLPTQLGPMRNLECTPDPHRLAYIIYTSGSTGTPKGVCVTQLNIMSNLDALSNIYPVSDNSRLLQSCSQAFDVSVFEIFFAWTQGICLCSATNDTLFENLERSIRKLKVTHLSMTPTVASLIDPANVPLVEFLVTAGEAMTEPVARKWGKKLYQGYGPSETTNICSVKQMGSDDVIQHLGWVFKNTSTFVLAQGGMDPVPLGCLGELCFGGDQVAQGYLDMPDLTAVKFINHPEFGRLYRSGDLGRMHPDGSLFIVGRTDDQVKIRGQRVELQEITETLRRSAFGADVTTLFLRGEEIGSQDKIVSFWVPTQYHAVDFEVLDVDDELAKSIQSLYRAIAGQLPAYMVPSAIIPITTLPTTASGKLDRSRLKVASRGLVKDYLALVSHRADLDTDDGDWSDAEVRVAEAVSGALNVRRGDIKRWTPLTTLGLDSISVIQVSRHLQESLGKRFPISLILQNASVARLAQALPADYVRDPRLEEADLVPKSLAEKAAEKLDRPGLLIDEILPCTPLQEAMLAMSTSKGQYFNYMLFRVTGDLGRLKASWDAMCSRHGILRTCFVPMDDAQYPILQVVLSRWRPPWHSFDASLSTVENCISRHAKGVSSPLETMEPAVSFATIARGDCVYLSFVCHHALYDGVAIERLLYEIEQHFAGASLPPPLEYGRFLREALVLPASTDKFWLGHLARYEPKLTSDLRSGNPSIGSPVGAYDLDVSLSQIRTKVREFGVSLLALTQSAWAIALGCLFRTGDVCFGNVVNGRSLPLEGIEELVAPCFNTVPVRFNISSCQRNVDLMKAFQSINVEVMQYQFTPLKRIQSLVSKHGARRLFDTLLLLQQPSRSLDQSLWTLERDDGEMDVPLVCELIPIDSIDRLVVKMHTAKSSQLPDDIVRLAFDLLSCAMRRCLEFPASRLLLEDVPEGLAERLAHIEVRPPQSSLTTHLSRHPEEEWTEVESSIRVVLAKLSSSSAERIRRHTTIYHLGLDSISAVRIAAMLRNLGYHVAASDVIDNPTCQSLGQLIAARAPALEDESAFNLAGFQSQVLPQVIAQGVPADDIEVILPCTPFQSAMMAQFVKSGGIDYFNYMCFELDNDVDTSNLIRAWESLSLTQPILRTAVIPIEHDEIAFAMIQHRLPELTAVELTDEIDPELWRLRVARSAVSEPWKGLWKVAIVGSKMHLTIHHALYDAHSLQLLLKDLAKALAENMTSPPSRTEDVVVDILGQVSAKMESSAQFWKQQAQDFVINSFPVMTPLRQATRDVLSEVFTSSLPLSTLEEAAARAGYPLQVILQAAWTRVLSGYLGESKMIFGVVLSGRSTETTRNAVFPCVTTLPVISSNSDSNCTLLTQMLKYNTELFGQQHQSLTHIQKWLGCPDVRLFDTLLVYQKLDIAPAERSPWRIIEEKANIDYPVSIEIEPTQGDRLRYQITFFSDVLPKQQATILLKQFDAAIHYLALEPNGQEPNLFALRPDLFSILPPEMREIPTTVKSLHHFVELQALSTPNATALHFVERFDNGVPVGRTWTYAELDANGNRVAQMLHPHVNRGDIVAVYFDKCPAAYFSILGILKSGCAFVALDPAAPRSRNELIIMDSGVSVLLTALDGKGQLWKPLTSAVSVLTIDEDSLLAVPADPQISNRDVQPDDVCYCLYTSGTTGTPKGCLITHDNAVQCMLAFQRIFQGHWQEDSKWLQFASLHFDVSVLEQYWSWSVGITLVAAPRDLILEDLAAAISRLGITHIDLTPSLARLLHPDDVPSLCKGVFITGGESLKQEILDVWGSKAVIYNFYGPTEATIGVTVYPRVPTSGRASNIGRQFVNVGSYVLKRGTEQPVLRGGVGELCVSGRLVGKGYLKREGLTAEKFPTLQHFGDRVYRTGDLVRVLHDGCFDFLGRADDQVKLRGQRLEIGEINHTIRKGVETVTDVATLVVRDEVNAKDLLVSFIVGANTARTLAGPLRIIESPDALDLCRRARDACRSKLPAYMVPTYVLQMSCIPLSANNKTDIKTLGTFVSWLSPEKLVSLSCSTEQARRTLSLTEGKIAKALAEMQYLDMSLILPNSSIFELGIDSISVLRFCRALRKEGLVQATPSLVLRHPLLCDLAGALEVPKRSSNSESIAAARQLVQACAHKHRSHVCGELGVTPDQIEYIAPCSPLQQGMISRVEIDGAYFNTFRFQLAREVSPQLLRQAWQKTVDALPILRTKFVRTIDGFVQVALKELVMQWRERQIQVCGESTVEDAIVESRESWIAKNQGSLVQPLEAVLVYVGCTGQRLLLLHIFHGLYDANSLLLVLDRVAREYQSLAGGYLGKTPASGPPFFDALLHGPLQDFSSSRSFWVKHFDGVTFSTAITTSVSTSTISAHQDVSLRRLEPLRKGLGVTHQAIIQAAWVSVLAKHLAANPTIGIIFSGRTIELEGIEKVVGPLFNTLPFQARLSTENGTSGTTWASLIRQCHDFNTAVLAFPHVPLRDIQKWCSRGQAMFNTLFSFHRSDAAVAVEQELWTTVDSEPSADYPLALEATLSSDDCMRLLLVAQSAAYSQDKLSDCMDGLQWAFDAMAENADQIITPNEQGPIGNGHGNDARNGLDDLVDDTPQTFAWTEEASLLRDEVAKLANIVPETVTEATPLFGLGLDSIDVIKLSARLKRHGIRIKTSELMKAQSIAAALQLLKRRGDDAQHNGPTTSLSVGSEARSRLREYLAGLGELGDGDIALPATPLQESMIAGMIESDFRLYFNHDIREIAPSVNIGRLKAAWNTVIAGSPILRTIFLPVDSPDFEFTYCQVIRRESSPRISDVGLDFRDQLAMVCDAATQRALEGAGRSNLLQITFASIGEQKFLVLSIAHALYDGWSLGLLHQDVQRAYEGSYSPGDMEDYVSQLDTLLFRGHQDASSFWSGFLRDSNPTLFPWSQETPEQEGTAHHVELASSLPSTEIASFCKSQAVTLQTLGQACWAALLAARTGALDVIFGVVLSGRDYEALEDLVFPTMNTVAIRSVLHGTVSSWVRYMQDNVASILPHQHFPLREAQKLAQAKGPLFNTLFIHQREVDSPSRREWEQLLKSVDGSSAVEYPVCVEMASSSGGQLTWRAAINATCGTHDDSVRLLKELDSVLAYLVRSPDAEVLVFGNAEVSICGLGPTALGVKDDTSTTTPSGPSTGESDVSWSPIEKKIRDVLSEVSGVPVASILRRHNIYHLGLDSISAIKAGSLLRKKGIDVGFRDVLKSRSIADMAQIVSATGSEAPLSSNESDCPNPNPAAWDADIDVASAFSDAGVNESVVQEVLPATPMQVHMLSVWQNTNGEVFYPLFTFILRGRVDKAAITTAWEALVAETPILRTVFISTGSRLIPILQAIIQPSVVHQGWSSASPGIWGSDTAPGGLVQPYHHFHAEECGPETWKIQLRIHHALYDAVSLMTLMDRFSALCTTTEQPANPESDWREAVRECASEKRRASRKKFWTQCLARVVPTPLSSFGQEQKEYEGSSSRTRVVRKAALNALEVSKLKGRCKFQGISLQSLFFAAYAEVLASSAQGVRPERVMFGVYFASHDSWWPRVKNSRTSYPQLRLVPLRVVLEDGYSLLDVARMILSDIHVFSLAKQAEVGAWEIMDWTGLKVDSFVNFLSLPARDEDDADGVKVELEPLMVADGEAGSQEGREASEEYRIPRELANNAVRDAYADQTDIEVSVKGDEMTIGVFGPGWLGVDGGTRIIDRIVEVLKGVPAVRD